MTALQAQLVELIAEEALVEKDKLTPEATLADAGLDSVGVVSVAFAIEEKYGVELPEDAFAGVTNFGQFLAVVEAAIASKAPS